MRMATGGLVLIAFTARDELTIRSRERSRLFLTLLDHR